ncbi:DUF4304 domain-containing protein [Taylorella equigenitalis]|uniref:DUF4304 domain-containing protein n=1 Tax=Taylorella equigenitalis TaxID=29575 RepID=UPI00237E8086|nr:DUF4304 domain-containing protein [Taylorella equigenitalis]WDU51310.1 DUF4304 domain-containing protein [Taylorella equigenitalis]
MDYKQFFSALKSALILRGFKSSGKYFYITDKFISLIIWIQKSRFSDSYFINVSIKKYQEGEKYKDVDIQPDCSGRLDSFLPDKFHNLSVINFEEPNYIDKINFLLDNINSIVDTLLNYLEIDNLYVLADKGNPLIGLSSRLKNKKIHN